jgi:hypothetical protein
MPKGPKVQKRPTDVIGNAVKVMRIATGEEAEDFGADDGKDKAAQSLGQRGGSLAVNGGASRFVLVEVAARGAWTISGSSRISPSRSETPCTRADPGARAGNPG